MAFFCLQHSIIGSHTAYMICTEDSASRYCIDTAHAELASPLFIEGYF